MGQVPSHRWPLHPGTALRAGRNRFLQQLSALRSHAQDPAGQEEKHRNPAHPQVIPGCVVPLWAAGHAPRLYPCYSQNPNTCSSGSWVLPGQRMLPRSPQSERVRNKPLHSLGVRQDTDGPLGQMVGFRCQGLMESGGWALPR